MERDRRPPAWRNEFYVESDFEDLSDLNSFIEDDSVTLCEDSPYGRKARKLSLLSDSSLSSEITNEDTEKKKKKKKKENTEKRENKENKENSEFNIETLSSLKDANLNKKTNEKQA